MTGGRILLQGEDITHAPLARLRELRATRMSMIFQEPMTALNPVMTCGDQIDEVLAEHTEASPAERRAKVRAIIERGAAARPRAHDAPATRTSCRAGSASAS